MNLRFQFEDERAIIHDQPPDMIGIPVADFINRKFGPEIIYLHRWQDGYTYDGTAHTKDDTILIQVRDNTLYYLRKSQKGTHVEGHPLSSCPRASSIPVGSL